MASQTCWFSTGTLLEDGFYQGPLITVEQHAEWWALPKAGSSPSSAPFQLCDPG